MLGFLQRRGFDYSTATRAYAILSEEADLPDESADLDFESE
jgi:SOS response regulatory protein OraA/RecX